MKLDHLDAKLRELQNEKTIGTYSVIVCDGRDRAVLCSEDADTDTYYDSASMGKVLVTSTLILKAVGEGRISLDDALPRFFDNVPDDKKVCTVRQLLTHTSGIIRVNFSREIADRGRDALAAHILSVPLGFEPGRGMRYSCNGFILLGIILEKLYGMRLDELFEATTKKTLGLTRSRFNIAPDEPNAATCWRRAEIGDCVCDDENVCAMRGVGGNGASFWTAADIERFVLAVLRRDTRLYPDELFDLAERDYTPDAENGRGLGYLYVDGRYPQTGKLFPAGSFGHCGHTGTCFFMDRAAGMYVILLTNATRCANMKNGFRGYNYGDVMKMRETLHNEILRDLG